MRPIIQSEKHYVQQSPFTVPVGTVTRSLVVDAVQVLNKNATFEVEEGSIIKAVFCEFWILADQAAFGNVTITLEKYPSNSPVQTFTNSQNLGAYDNKKNILYTTQGLIPGNGENPVALLRNWFKIPKGKQRFGLGDKLALNFANVVGGLNVCGFSTYKEYK